MIQSPLSTRKTSNPTGVGHGSRRNKESQVFVEDFPIDANPGSGKMGASKHADTSILGFHSEQRRYRELGHNIIFLLYVILYCGLGHHCEFLAPPGTLIAILT